MLLLRGPTRQANDVAISLRAPSGCPVVAARVADVARSMRCPPPTVERVRSCILHSGRYDCRVSAAVAFLLARSPDLMGRCGGHAVLTDADHPSG